MNGLEPDSSKAPLAATRDDDRLEKGLAAADAVLLHWNEKIATAARAGRWDIAQLLNVLPMSDDFEPDWSEAPKWARYYAIDADAEGWWYEVEPTSYVDCWNTDYGKRFRAGGVCEGWLNTLRKRPEADDD